MIGRAAVTDPRIFSRLKGFVPPSIDTVRNEYLMLSKSFAEPQRYRNSILRFLGKSSNEGFLEMW
jgi:hypothetical protein